MQLAFGQSRIRSKSYPVGWEPLKTFWVRRTIKTLMCGLMDVWCSIFLHNSRSFWFQVSTELKRKRTMTSFRSTTELGHFQIMSFRNGLGLQRILIVTVCKSTVFLEGSGRSHWCTFRKTGSIGTIFRHAQTTRDGRKRSKSCKNPAEVQFELRSCEAFYGRKTSTRSVIYE